MRVGLFGGTFDPPHLGHLAVANAVRERFSLDRILLAPAAVQPLKPDGAHATFAQRLRMVELLCQNHPGLEASAIDGPQPGGSPNFTIDTIARLRATLSAGAEIFVIVGADAFLGLRRWRDPDALLREARWIVVSRPGFDLGALDAMGLTPSQRARIDTLTNFANPVSATEVRERLHNRSEAAALVPPPVLDYICSHHLYRT
ncbi:MAG TPA: nicotinate (nicotinamide) nucleotide adenylyltransferase [Candidatus Aquilonibacter sp.]|nr:nicotinate (nicotinamide) nucleotide adenylyltransferase [Candidatus Aquilonibacter sp.]